MMISRLQQWIERSIAAGAFSAHRNVLRFALTRAAAITLAAMVLNFIIYHSLGYLDIIALPGDSYGDTVVTALVAGPIAFLAYYLVGRAIQDLAISRDAFERLSTVDPLTGLLNRRAFTQRVAKRDTPYVLAVIDIDRFKAINDTHGHAAGDAVLVSVAAELWHAFGDEAILARLGGEEFGVVLPDHGRDGVVAALDRAREGFCCRPFDVAGVALTVTFSAGISRGGRDQDYSTRLNEADKALYLAKAAGRNRVVHADDVVAIPPLGERLPQQLAG